MRRRSKTRSWALRPVLAPAESDMVAEQALADTRRLATRSAELGGEITADPREIIARSPFDDYRLPDDASDMSAILEYALAQVRTLIGAYKNVLEMTRAGDDITYRLVVDLLGHVVTREDEIEAALDVGPGTSYVDHHEMADRASRKGKIADRE